MLHLSLHLKAAQRQPNHPTTSRSQTPHELKSTIESIFDKDLIFWLRNSRSGFGLQFAASHNAQCSQLRHRSDWTVGSLASRVLESDPKHCRGSPLGVPISQRVWKQAPRTAIYLSGDVAISFQLRVGFCLPVLSVVVKKIEGVCGYPMVLLVSLSQKQICNGMHLIASKGDIWRYSNENFKFFYWIIMGLCYFKRLIKTDG